MKITGKIAALISRSFVPALVLAIGVIAGPAAAHAPNVMLSAFGTAMVDGVLSPGEWDGAAKISFDANVPAADGGGTTPVTLFVMNDTTSLYLALKIDRASFGGATNPVFEFDNNHNGVREGGDDVFGMSVGQFSPATFTDGFRFDCSGDPAGFPGCGPSDSYSPLPSGFPPPGTVDGATAATNDGSFTYIEISHPLNSLDNPHDFSLSPGDTVGFTLFLRLFNLSPPFGSFADSGFPTICVSCAGLFGDIVIAAPTVQVAIDIKPGSLPNSINSSSHGKIPVAILSSVTFDAPGQVNAGSLTFGRTGEEHSIAYCNASPEDVNGDGLLDLICHFTTQQTGFGSGDLEGVLRGLTVDGRPIIGTDSVRIVR